MKLTLKGAKKKADKAWSLAIRRKKYCEICGREANQPHHYIGRKNYTMRFDPRNGVLLCYTHHVGGRHSAHGDVEWFRLWFKENRPEDLEYIIKNKEKKIKRLVEDYVKIAEELNDEGN